MHSFNTDKAHQVVGLEMRDMQITANKLWYTFFVTKCNFPGLTSICYLQIVKSQHVIYVFMFWILHVMQKYAVYYHIIGCIERQNVSAYRKRLQIRCTSKFLKKASFDNASSVKSNYFNIY